MSCDGIVKYIDIRIYIGIVNHVEILIIVWIISE